jgi:hypothetical protein
MRSKNFLEVLWLIMGLFFLFQRVVPLAQQQDVPEPVFMNFSIQPLYVPTYHGRDPLKPLDNVERSPEYFNSELDYHGVIYIGRSSNGFVYMAGEIQ